MTLFPKTINYLKVTIADSNNDGRFEKTETPATFQGSVQPMSGKETESLNIGQQDEGVFKIYSGTKLNVSIEETDKSGDIILWQGRRWKIVDEQEYQNSLINHYKYIAVFDGEAA